MRWLRFRRFTADILDTAVPTIYREFDEEKLSGGALILMHDLPPTPHFMKRKPEGVTAVYTQTSLIF